MESDILMDILFGAVGITSLMLALFAVWLSWQFYVQSRGQSDSVKDAVHRIENVVNAVQGDIEKIVKQAIDVWASGQAPTPDTETAQALLENIETLSNRIDSLKQPANIDEFRDEVSKLLRQQEISAERLVTSMRESRLKSILPTYKEKAVSYSQELISSSLNEEQGLVTIDVSRPIPIATASCRFTKKIDSIPSLKVEFIDIPDAIEPPLLNSGMPTGDEIHSFNIHLNAKKGHLLNGQYIIKYTATKQ